MSSASIFESLRPSLARIAYRMLSSVADAEDVVQEAYLRWIRIDAEDVQEPAAFLRRVVSRLCLDHLKSAQHRRETYIGPWLPEPVVDNAPDIDDLSLPLLLLLQRLSPLERAAFLLHDVFGLEFDEIAQTLDREPAACRQLASRARTHVRAGRPRFSVSREKGREIAAAFFEASREGDMRRLRALLADDVVLLADGGGKISAASKPVVGAEKVVALHRSFAPYFAGGMSELLQSAFINGLPGFVSLEQTTHLQTTALAIENDLVVGIYVTRNPDKLRHLAYLLQ
jgi:RNA polymerase sigma-70 factor, ECF subfamily